VEFVENPEGLRFREDADGFDWVAGSVGPTTFFWSSVVFVDFVDRDRGWRTFVLGVVSVPIFEPEGSFGWSFVLPAGEGMHRLMKSETMKRTARINSSTGWRS
jgi:hypothetical protein